MSDAKPNATYSYGSAPVSNFQVVPRRDPRPAPEEFRKHMAKLFRRPETKEDGA